MGILAAMPNLRIEPLHEADGAHHMRVDTELFQDMESALREGRGGEATLPVLRLYTWDVPTVSLGKSQSPEVALAPRWEDWHRDPSSDPHGPRAVVKRPTGGRAVWHEQELTYSVVFPLSHPLFQRGAVGPDEAFGRWLLEGARRAGVEGLSLERGTPRSDPLGLGAAPCFASTSRNEVKWHGKKWIGSARRLGQAALLQHGAIRLGPAGDKLEEWLTGSVPVDDRPWVALPSAATLATSLILVLQEHLERSGA